MKDKSAFHWNKITVAAVAVSLMFCSVSDIGFNSIRINDFATPLSVEAYSTGNYKVKTSGSNLNVRSGPGTGYASVGKLSNGSAFTVYEISGNWGKISSSSSQWVSLTYSTYVGSTDTIVPAPSGKTGTGVVNCSALNVRTGPSTEYDVKTTIKCGANVNITQTSGNWGYDSNNGGYVSLNYISFTGGSTNNGGSTGGSSNYSTVDTNWNYQLEPQCAGNKVVDVYDWRTDNNTNIQIWERGKTQTNQTFQPISAGNGYYLLKDVNSGKVLDVCGGNAYDGANVILYEQHGGANQLWRFIYKGKENGHNWYELESKINGNYCLDVSGANSANGTNIQLWSRNGSSAQKFMMWYGNVGGSTGGGSNIIEKIKEIITVNDTKGHSEFKPRQQKNYSYTICSCGAKISGSGCGLMATVNAVGYLTGTEMNIENVAQSAKRHHQHAHNSDGSGAGCYNSVAHYIGVDLGSQYGFVETYRQSNRSSQISYNTTWGIIVEHLKKGEVVVGHVKGHYIAIVAYDKSTGKVLVYDSAANLDSRGTTSNGDWKSKNELDPNIGSAGKAKLKIDSDIICFARK